MSHCALWGVGAFALALVVGAFVHWRWRVPRHERIAGVAPSHEPAGKDDESARHVRAELNERAAVIHSDEPADRARNNIEWWKLGVEILTLAAVVWYACVAEEQRRAMIAQVKEMRRANKNTESAQTETAKTWFIENRPWVGIQRAAMLDFGTDRPARVYAIVTNTGRTIATDATIIGGAWIRNTKDPPKGAVEKTPILTGPMPVLPAMSSEIRFASEKVGADIKAAIKDTKKFLVVAGRVTYRDTTGGWHRTDFCIFYVPDRDTTAFCPTDNYAD